MRSHTIANQNSPSVSPSLEQHVLIVHLRNAFGRCSVEQITHRPVRCLETTQQIQRLLILLRYPVRGFELVVRDLLNTELNDDVPAYPVAGDREKHPLTRGSTFGEVF